MESVFWRFPESFNSELDMSVTLIVAPAANGQESQDFAQMLVKMYTKWAARHEVKMSVMGESGQEWQLLFDVDMKTLDGEHGIHRLCRNSPHDAEARRWTSFVAVAVKGYDKPLERLRSYTLDPYKQALDLKKRYSTDNVENVLEGGEELDKMMTVAAGLYDIPGAEGAFIERRTLTKEELDHALTLVPTIEP
jgi:protein subunit release factor B